MDEGGGNAVEMDSSGLFEGITGGASSSGGSYLVSQKR